MSRQVPYDISEYPFDLIVVSAGINGAGIARDAAMRGLRVQTCSQTLRSVAVATLRRIAAILGSPGVGRSAGVRVPRVPGDPRFRPFGGLPAP